MAETKNENKAIEQKYVLRQTAIICSTILGMMSLIGLFWGKAGLEYMGGAILVLMIVVITFMASTPAYY